MEPGKRNRKSDKVDGGSGAVSVSVLGVCTSAQVWACGGVVEGASCVVCQGRETDFEPVCKGVSGRCGARN
jgi:hypothetical protein